MTTQRLQFAGFMLAAILCAFLAGRATSSASFAVAAGPPDSDRPLHRPAPHGLVVVPSEFTPEKTAERLMVAASQGGATVLAEIDHAAAAADTGRELRPTRVLLIGNPLAGTPLMVASQTAGIDLPLKFLIYEDAEGQVLLAYNSTRHLKRRHRIRGEDELLSTIETNQHALAEAATRN